MSASNQARINEFMIANGQDVANASGSQERVKKYSRRILTEATTYVENPTGSLEGRER